MNGWRGRLSQFVRGVAATPFEYGTHDCATFAFGAVEAMTGTDHLAPYRGRYDSHKSGMRVLQEDGHQDHIALAAATLTEIEPACMAQVGDVAVVSDGRHDVLGVVQGERIWVLRLEGVGTVSLTEIKRAFRA